MTEQNLTPQTIRHLLDKDFRDAWNALAEIPEARARGNFMFGREAVGLLELASRVCHEDPAGLAIIDLSTAIEQIEPKYFTPMPAPAHWPKDFDLPFCPTNGPRDQQLMCVIYDLVRHGQAHQRQQIMVETNDNKTFGISLTGAAYGRRLEDRLAGGRPPEHLSLLCSDIGDVFLVLCPEVLFLDLKQRSTRPVSFTAGSRSRTLRAARQVNRTMRTPLQLPSRHCRPAATPHTYRPRASPNERTPTLPRAVPATRMRQR